MEQEKLSDEEPVLLYRGLGCGSQCPQSGTIVYNFGSTLGVCLMPSSGLRGLQAHMWFIPTHPGKTLK